MQKQFCRKCHCQCANHVVLQASHLQLANQWLLVVVVVEETNKHLAALAEEILPRCGFFQQVHEENDRDRWLANKCPSTS